MGIRDVLKVSRKTFFNPRAWLGYDALKEQTRTLWTFTKDAVVAPPAEPQRVESFEEAMARLGISTEDVAQTGKTYFYYALLFLFLALCDVVYGVYLLFNNHAFLGMVLALAVCALLLSQAFRYHFWYFQIQQRKLGCTFEEWRAGKIQPKEGSGQDEAP